MLRNTFMIAVAISFAQSLHAQQVMTSGAMRNVMMGIDLSPTVALDTLTAKPSLYALGPLEDLKGEITVYNSQVFVSSIKDDTINTVIRPNVSAPFLVYAYVEGWKEYELDIDISGLQGIEHLIDSLAQVEGRDVNKAFPVMLQADWDWLEYHIINLKNTKIEHSHAAHDRAKVKFSRSNAPGRLIGFYSQNHQGVFTHHGEFLHIHYLNTNFPETGHLDDLEHQGKLKLYLPVLE
ncbi:MAG: acetolactate decarboxylase [Owenweeksia sp.]|nr:acetolactate decarboxylase [Owenweeksia sp.]